MSNRLPHTPSPTNNDDDDVELGPMQVSEGKFDDEDEGGMMQQRTRTASYKANDDEDDDNDAGDEEEDGLVHASSSNFRKKHSTIMVSLNRRKSGIDQPEEEDAEEEHDDADEAVNNGGAKPGKMTLKEIYIQMSEKEFSFSHRFFNIIHGDPMVSPDDIIGTVYHTCLIFAIILSILTLIIGSDPYFYNPDKEDETFFVMEAVCVGLFSVDVILQVISAEAIEQIVHVQFFIDTMSVVGFYLELILAAAGTSASTSGLVVLRIFRLTRILRVLKVSSAANAMELVFTTLINSKQGLLMLISLISVVTLLGGAVLFFLEQQYSEFYDPTLQWYRNDGELSPFQSVPSTFWFVIATITTIGYGDVVPYSIIGKTITMILMLFGVLLLSFPNILIGAQFQLIHSTFRRAKARNSLGKVFRKARMIIRFVRLWREYSVKGTIEQLIEENPTMEIPDEEEDEGDLDLFGNNDEEEEEEAATISGKDDETTSSGGDNFVVENLLHVPEQMRKRNRHYVNFWFYPGEFPAVDFDVGEFQLAHGLFHKVFIGGKDSGGSRFSALQLGQRLLENFSGCATADEIFESFALYPPYPGANIRRSDIILMMLLLGKSRHLFLFVISRTEENYLAAFSKSGLAMMRTFPESGLSTCPCFRSIGQAASIWKRTTKKSYCLENPAGFDGYPKWTVAQSLVMCYDVTNFTENLRLTSARRNHVVFLKSGFVPSYPPEKHLGSEYAFGTGLGPRSPGTNLVLGASSRGAALSKEQAAIAMNQMLSRSLAESRSTTPQASHLEPPSSHNNGGLHASFNLSLTKHPLSAPGSSTPPPSSLPPVSPPSHMVFTAPSSSSSGGAGPAPLKMPELPAISITSTAAGGGSTDAPHNGGSGGQHLQPTTPRTAGGGGGGGAAEQFAFLGDYCTPSGSGVSCYCPHCVHCMTQDAILPQNVPESRWRAKKEQALSNFIWKQDEETIELQIEYLQNWLKIMRHAKAHPHLVPKPPEEGLLKSSVIRTTKGSPSSSLRSSPSPNSSLRANKEKNKDSSRLDVPSSTPSKH